MSATDPITLWITQVKEGDRAAVQPLLERYFQRLIQLARARLRGVPGLAVYDEDVALSAFKSLCLGAERGRFPRLDDRDDLWRLLAVLTIRKAIDLVRRQQAKGETAEVDLTDLLSQEPDPELAVQMGEEYQRLLARLDDDELRSVALWKVEGHTNEEIAGRLGCAVRSVERKMQRIRILWAEEATA
jgi:DNA-directed RNA polymerase specialized sigma24 family protein